MEAVPRSTTPNCRGVNMSDIYRIRRFQDGDADEVSELIIKTLRTTNIKDYSAEYIENDVKMFAPNGVIERVLEER